jgi:hypothetical protein
MVELKLGGHNLVVYDAIDEIPIVRFHKYQKLLLIDAGIGSDLGAIDQRIARAKQFFADGKAEKGEKELENLRQAIFFVQNGLSPKHKAFAALVKAFDGKEVGNTDAEMDEITQKLQDATESELTARLEAVKKKIDAELRIYFPQLFADSEVKEYFDLLKKRTIAVLENIANGVRHPDKTKEVEKLTAELITYSNPKAFAGAEGAEVQFDRQFENLCLAISEQLHLKPKDCSVLEFYNAFDFLQERAKQAERAKRGRK